MLAWAASPERVLGDVRRSLDVAGRHERVARPDDVRIELGALLDVGLNEELTARLEQPSDLRQEDVAHDEALLVPLLPPRIGEVKEHPAHAPGGTEAGQRMPSVLTEDARVGAVPVLGEPLIADGGPLATDLEPDQERFGRRRSAFEKKAGLRPGTNLELDPLAASEEPEVDLVPRRTCQWQARRVRVGSATLALGLGLALHALRRLGAHPVMVKVARVKVPRVMSARALTMRLLRWAPLVLATALLSQRAIGGILEKVGHPGAALDDAYIHFQYARAMAEGHPFRFQAGEPISTGATSFLWPMLLAPFYALGFRGQSILWPAWALSFLALGALAYEAYVLAKPLAGRAAAIGAGAMVLAFGGFAWCAASGMEVLPFAWLIATSTRRASEWAEDPARRTRRGLVVLAALALLCPLMRPEGALTSVALGVVVFFFPRPHAIRVAGRDVSRAEAAIFVLAALAPSLLLLALTGKATSSTAQVKLLPGNPYYVVVDATLANAKLLVGTILDGQVWSAEFLPKGGAIIACLGLAALIWQGLTTKHHVRAALVLLLALSMFVPCVYVTFLWNRLRYLWPFATGWFIGLACLARAAASLVARFDRRAGAATVALLAGAAAGTMAVRLDWVLEDVAQSASGIDRQQSALGRWAKGALPSDARIGVNDTGAIAYFGDRKTFDIVGLTTPTEGRYWVAGAASRLEHYERLAEEKKWSALPTHFIVYPEWMGTDAILGEKLHEATVTDATILGGQTMRASKARWGHLGSGELPWTTTTKIHDTIDVADLESESSHGYELLGAHEGEQRVQEGNPPSAANDATAASAAIILDGGRTNRSRDRFFARLPAEGKLIGIARVETTAPATFRLNIEGKSIAQVPLEAGPWAEIRFEVPESARGERVLIEVSAEGAPFTSYHYWFASP